MSVSILAFVLLVCGLSVSVVETVAAQDAPTDEESATSSQEDLEYDPLFDDDFDLEMEDAISGFPDPLEPVNRAFLGFNRHVDSWVLDPITRLYRFVLPEPIRRATSRFFDNLNSPQVMVNDIFQLEWKDAGVVGARLVVNSTVGLAGLFDPAENIGLSQHKSDFGQTLALAGAPSGPYFVIPLLGPTNMRDGIGLGVDALFHPTFYVLAGTDLLFFGGSAGLSARARHYEELKALEEGSVDFYAALRNGFYQNRMSEIWSRREERRPPGTN